MEKQFSPIFFCKKRLLFITTFQIGFTPQWYPYIAKKARQSAQQGAGLQGFIYPAVCHMSLKYALTSFKKFRRKLPKNHFIVK